MKGSLKSGLGELAGELRDTDVFQVLSARRVGQSKTDELMHLVPYPEGVDVKNPLPEWRRLQLSAKIPFVRAPKDYTVYKRGKLGESVRRQGETFDLSDPYNYGLQMKYEPIHDKYLRNFFYSPGNKKILDDMGMLTKENNVKCSLGEYNAYRGYVYNVHKNSVMKALKQKEEMEKDKAVARQFLSEAVSLRESQGERERRGKEALLRATQRRVISACRQLVCESRLKKIEQVREKMRKLKEQARLKMLVNQNNFQEQLKNYKLKSLEVNWKRNIRAQNKWKKVGELEEYRKYVTSEVERISKLYTIIEDWIKKEIFQLKTRERDGRIYQNYKVFSKKRQNARERLFRQIQQENDAKIAEMRSKGPTPLKTLEKQEYYKRVGDIIAGLKTIPPNMNVNKYEKPVFQEIMNNAVEDENKPLAKKYWGRNTSKSRFTLSSFQDRGPHHRSSGDLSNETPPGHSEVPHYSSPLSSDDETEITDCILQCVYIRTAKLYLKYTIFRSLPTLITELKHIIASFEEDMSRKKCSVDEIRRFARSYVGGRKGDMYHTPQTFTNYAYLGRLKRRLYKRRKNDLCHCESESILNKKIVQFAPRPTSAVVERKKISFNMEEEYETEKIMKPTTNIQPVKPKRREITSILKSCPFRSTKTDENNENNSFNCCQSDALEKSVCDCSIKDSKKVAFNLQSKNEIFETQIGKNAEIGHKVSFSNKPQIFYYPTDEAITKISSAITNVDPKKCVSKTSELMLQSSDAGLEPSFVICNEKSEETTKTCIKPKLSFEEINTDKNRPSTVIRNSLFKLNFIKSAYGPDSKLIYSVEKSSSEISVPSNESYFLKSDTYENQNNSKIIDSRITLCSTSSDYSTDLEFNLTKDGKNTLKNESLKYFRKSGNDKMSRNIENRSFSSNDTLFLKKHGQNIKKCIKNLNSDGRKKYKKAIKKESGINENLKSFKKDGNDDNKIILNQNEGFWNKNEDSDCEYFANRMQTRKNDELRDKILKYVNTDEKNAECAKVEILEQGNNNTVIKSDTNSIESYENARIITLPKTKDQEPNDQKGAEETVELMFGAEIGISKSVESTDGLAEDSPMIGDKKRGKDIAKCVRSPSDKELLIMQFTKNNIETSKPAGYDYLQQIFNPSYKPKYYPEKVPEYDKTSIQKKTDYSPAENCSLVPKFMRDFKLNNFEDLREFAQLQTEINEADALAAIKTISEKNENKCEKSLNEINLEKLKKFSKDVLPGVSDMYKKCVKVIKQNFSESKNLKPNFDFEDDFQIEEAPTSTMFPGENMPGKKLSCTKLLMEAVPEINDIYMEFFDRDWPEITPQIEPTIQKVVAAKKKGEKENVGVKRAYSNPDDVIADSRNYKESSRKGVISFLNKIPTKKVQSLKKNKKLEEKKTPEMKNIRPGSSSSSEFEKAPEIHKFNFLQNTGLTEPNFLKLCDVCNACPLQNHDRTEDWKETNIYNLLKCKNCGACVHDFTDNESEDEIIHKNKPVIQKYEDISSDYELEIFYMTEKDLKYHNHKKANQYWQGYSNLKAVFGHDFDNDKFVYFVKNDEDYICIRELLKKRYPQKPFPWNKVKLRRLMKRKVPICKVKENVRAIDLFRTKVAEAYKRWEESKAVETEGGTIELKWNKVPKEYEKLFSTTAASANKPARTLKPIKNRQPTPMPSTTDLMEHIAEESSNNFYEARRMVTETRAGAGLIKTKVDTAVCGLMESATIVAVMKLKEGYPSLRKMMSERQQNFYFLPTGYHSYYADKLAKGFQELLYSVELKMIKFSHLQPLVDIILRNLIRPSTYPLVFPESAVDLLYMTDSEEEKLIKLK